MSGYYDEAVTPNNPRQYAGGSIGITLDQTVPTPPSVNDLMDRLATAVDQLRELNSVLDNKVAQVQGPQPIAGFVGALNNAKNDYPTPVSLASYIADLQQELSRLDTLVYRL